MSRPRWPDSHELPFDDPGSIQGLGERHGWSPALGTSQARCLHGLRLLPNSLVVPYRKRCNACATSDYLARLESETFMEGELS